MYLILLPGISGEFEFAAGCISEANVITSTLWKPAWMVYISVQSSGTRDDHTATISTAVPCLVAQLLALTALPRKQKSLLLVASQNLGKIILVVASAKSRSYCPVFSISEVGKPSSCCPHLLQFFPLNISGYNVLFPIVMYGHESWSIKEAEH